MYFPADEEKIPLLLGLLSRSEGARTMVFVNTKAWVERVARALERGGYRVGVLSGDVPQKKRESLLAKFQKGQLEILVATDVAARGLHIDGVSHVYNYDLPFDAEDYVHRIGRTARLGAEGDAISFACERYAQSLPDIEAYIEQKIPVEPVTAELLVALPRKPREGVEARCRRRRKHRRDLQGSARAARRRGRSVAASRAAVAAAAVRGRGAASGPRSGSGARRGASRTRSASAAQAPMPAPRPQVAARPVSRLPPAAAAAVEGERAPRKRRRRRGGKRIEGGDDAVQQTQPNTSPKRTPSKPQRQAGREAGVGRHRPRCCRASARA